MTRFFASVTIGLLASTAIAQTELRITHPMSSGAGKAAFDQIVAKFEVIVTVVAVALTLGLATAAAFAFSRLEFPDRKLF